MEQKSQDNSEFKDTSELQRHIFWLPRLQAPPLFGREIIKQTSNMQMKEADRRIQQSWL